MWFRLHVNVRRTRTCMCGVWLNLSLLVVIQLNEVDLVKVRPVRRSRRYSRKRHTMLDVCRKNLLPAGADSLGGRQARRYAPRRCTLRARLRSRLVALVMSVPHWWGGGTRKHARVTDAIEFEIGQSDQRSWNQAAVWTR